MSTHIPQTETELLDEAIASLKAIRNKCLSRPSVLDEPIANLEAKKRESSDNAYATRRGTA